MFVFLKDKSIDWSSLQDYTFILPAVSVGNIGQLSVDLLISSLRCDKLAKVDHPIFVPVVGSDPYDDIREQDLMTAAELYISKEKKLVILQIRGLLIKEFCADFLAKLVDWIKICSFTKTILLSSLYNYERVDSQLTGSPFRYTITSSVKSTVEEELKNLQWSALETRRSVWKEGTEEILFFPGGGYTNMLNKLCGKMNIPLVTLLIFCAEGDNIPGVLLITGHLNRWLNFVRMANDTPGWKFPASWKLFFGAPPPLTMY
ncbi:proteasome assembly chaperone 2-like [Daphnia carinata]|uniref:proteasome assembly chaperone 2-like n=1 Tax=Daphnia carinata TaxID=120202 RepID=UPI00257BCBF9|nr:proteasome assembly chaperone 2-like [Daphnia carinata]